MAVECPDLTALSEVRERLHRKAGDYFCFENRRWDDARWREFFGATDALLDTTFALGDVAAGIPSHREHAILWCYGFLQALYIQQDAVKLIWRALEMSGDPLVDARLQTVREIRNRVAGHPARAEKPGRGRVPSSAIINIHDIEPSTGFKAVIYYDSGMETVDVSFATMLSENSAGLLGALQKAEAAMVERELQFRRTECAKPLMSGFGSGFGYTLEKLRCSPDDPRREMAMRSLARVLDRIEADLTARGFWYEGINYQVAAIRSGIKLGERIFDLTSAEDAESNWRVIGEGIAGHVADLRKQIEALDDKLASTPS